PGDLRRQATLLRRTRFEPISHPFIGTRRNDDALRDLERIGQPLADRYGVELDAIAAAKPPVDRRPEDAIALPTPGEIGGQRGLEFEEHLLNRTTRQPRTEVRAGIPEVDG